MAACTERGTRRPMALYRIYADGDHYLNFVIHGSEVIRKLGGRDYPFHIDPTPKPYADVWKTPLDVDFHYGDDTRGKAIPDINVNGGRLYFSGDAHARLHAIVDAAGEFLPVRHKDGAGYVFNPLKTAEEVDGLDESRTLYDRHGNLEHFGFHEDRVRNLPIFRTGMDSYQGVFCHDAFKGAVESGGFAGVFFGPDVSNRLGVSHGSLH